MKGATALRAWKAFVYFALLVLLPAHVRSQTAITNANIGTAVTTWLTNPTDAATTYGNIVGWNTAAVTSMANLFYPSTTARPTFNDDITSWNTASVSNMRAVRSLALASLLWCMALHCAFGSACVATALLARCTL